MRRTLLIAAYSLFLAGTQAFAADQQKWSKSVENTVSKWEELNLQAPTAVDNAGNRSIHATDCHRKRRA